MCQQDTLYTWCWFLFLSAWNQTSDDGRVIKIILQRAVKTVPTAKPWTISDNGPQILKGSGMTHIRASYFYPQSNGKIERWHQSIKKECVRPLTPTILAKAHYATKFGQLSRKWKNQYWRCRGWCLPQSRYQCSARFGSGSASPRSVRYCPCSWVLSPKGGKY